MILNAIQSFFEYALKFIKLLRISDIADICLLTLVIYYIMTAIKGTRAVQLLRGIFVAIVVYMLSSILRLDTINYILGKVFQGAMIAIIVIFQPELRNVLEHMGRLKLGHFFGLAFDTETNIINTERVIENVTAAAIDLSAEKTGALMVIERQTRLGEYMNSGTQLNADVTSELLKNIFVPNTPLHDGAVIIRDGRILNAGCVLPLTANTNLSSELGTRHRAALGLSEASDAVVVVVSEETGKISIAMNGSLVRNLTKASLTRALQKSLVSDTGNNKDTLDKIKFWKSK